jgi:hypothetical protein
VPMSPPGGARDTSPGPAPTGGAGGPLGGGRIEVLPVRAVRRVRWPTVGIPSRPSWPTTLGTRAPVIPVEMGSLAGRSARLLPGPPTPRRHSPGGDLW